MSMVTEQYLIQEYHRLLDLAEFSVELVCVTAILAVILDALLMFVWLRLRRCA
ncbi:MAG: hypothetical protein ACTSPB_18265 [Candidatus Thorarchaeota archaeon]